MAQIPTQSGIQGCKLVPASLLYELATKHNVPLALAMGKAGATVYLYGLAGYQVKPEPKPSTPTTYIEALEALVLSEKEKLRLASANEALRAKVDELYNYSSIVRIAVFNKVDEKTLSWRDLKKVSEVNGWKVLKATCPRFGYKNIYDHRAFEAMYPYLELPEEGEDLDILLY